MTSMKKPPAGDAAKGAKGSTKNLNPTAESDTKQALGFIESHSKSWRPDWYVQVVAIDPDGIIKAMSVHPDQINTLGPFIDQYQGKYGLYFAVNPLRRDPGTKASKSDVAALAYHHVDLDPRNHEPLEGEKLRLIAIVEDFPLQPSSVVDSGNGLGAFYRLAEPILHDGNTEALEQTNKRLEQYFGADHCHNLDRIMRLPGSVNLPTASKIAKGRSAVPVPTKLIYQNDNTCSLEDFAFLPPAAPKNKVADLGDVDLGSIDELSLATRYALHQQHDPDLKLILAGQAPAWSKDKDGSGLDHAYALTLSRLGYSRAENFRLLMSYDHGKKSRVRDEKYLRATIDKFYAPKEKEPDAPTTASGWQNLTLKDGAITLADLHKVDPPWAHAIDPICPRGVMTVYGGANGLGKSTDALSQGLHVATGRSYYGMPVVQGRAIFITAEDPRAVVKSRIQAWLVGLPEAERVRAERDICKNFFYFGADETSGMRLTGKEFSQCAPSREAIEMLVALAHGAVSICLETVAMLNAGDEMNTDLMQLALALKEVASRTGAAVQVVHHVAKDARTGKPDAYSLRGGGSLVDAARSVLLMQELLPGQMDDLNITRIDGAPVMGLYHVKASYAPRHPPLYLRRVEGPCFIQVNASEAQGKEHARNRLMQFLQKPENREGVSVRYLKDNCTKFKIEKREVESVLLKLEELRWVKRVDSTDLGKAGPKHDIWMLNSLL
jgi:RecA-family ATPase